MMMTATMMMMTAMIAVVVGEGSFLILSLMLSPMARRMNLKVHLEMPI
jgi:hypothetical protein